LSGYLPIFIVLRRRIGDPAVMDATDQRILRALPAAAAPSNDELAEEVGLSPSPCWTG
jgi:Lrp/AsnC family leucine-responsive transcriptional regulator